MAVTILGTWDAEERDLRSWRFSQTKWPGVARRSLEMITKAELESKNIKQQQKHLKLHARNRYDPLKAVWV